MDWTDDQVDGFQRAEHALPFGRRFVAVFRLDRRRTVERSQLNSRRSIDSPILR